MAAVSLNVGGSSSCCLICCESCGEELDEKRVDEDIKLFALRYLLELPPDILEEWSGCCDLKTWQRVLCDQCSTSVMKGRELYCQLLTTVEKFRRIQRELVEKVRLARSEMEEEWRKSVISNSHDFTGPFTLHPEFGMEGVDVKEEEPEVSIDAESEDSDEGPASLSDPLGFDVTSDTPVKSESEEDESDEVVEKMEESPENCFLNEDSDGGNEWIAPPKANANQEDDYHPSKRSPRKRKLTTRIYYETDEGEDDVGPAKPKKSHSGTVGSFKCQLAPCTKAYRYKYDLDRHMRDQHGIDNKKRKSSTADQCECELCGDKVPSEALLAHVRDHVGEEYLHKCPNPSCLMAFLHSFDLKKHLGFSNKTCRVAATPALLKCIKKGRYICDECGTGSTNIDLLQAHLERNHELSAKNLQCPISGCEATFCVRQSVEVHIAKGHAISNGSSERIQKCADCAKLFSVGDIQEHLRQAHGVKDPFKCSQCPSLYSSREHLIHHLYTSHRHSGIPFPCDICSSDGKDLGFTDHLSLRQHYYETHDLGQKFVCEHCQSVTWTNKLFQHHLKYVHNKLQLTCDICEGLVAGSSATFGTKDTLQTHKIKVHGAEPYKCPNCTQTFNTNQSLQNHIKIEHKRKVKPVFSCTISGCFCGGRTYSTQKTLTGHQAVVLGESKYVCDECGKHFRDSRQLKIHQDAVHLKIRSVICDTCGEGFFTKTQLKRHELIHTGERPYVCSKCGQRFRHRNALKTHVKAHAEKGDSFRPTGPMKHIRKRVQIKK